MRIHLLLKRNYIVLYVKEYLLVMKRRRLLAKQWIMRRRWLIKIKWSLEESNEKTKEWWKGNGQQLWWIIWKQTQSHAAPGITKEKGMHDSEVEVQTIEGTREKKVWLGEKWILRSLWNLISLKSGMNLSDRLLKQWNQMQINWLTWWRVLLPLTKKGNWKDHQD